MQCATEHHQIKVLWKSISKTAHDRKAENMPHNLQLTGHATVLTRIHSLQHMMLPHAQVSTSEHNQLLYLDTDTQWSHSYEVLTLSHYI